jgi:hypothetical protein
VRRLWFSCPSFTVRLVVNEHNVIVDAAPIVSRFIGQPLSNLERWALSRWGDIAVQEL